MIPRPSASASRCGKVMKTRPRRCTDGPTCRCTQPSRADETRSDQSRESEKMRWRAASWATLAGRYHEVCPDLGHLPRAATPPPPLQSGGLAPPPQAADRAAASAATERWPSSSKAVPESGLGARSRVRLLQLRWRSAFATSMRFCAGAHSRWFRRARRWLPSSAWPPECGFSTSHSGPTFRYAHLSDWDFVDAEPRFWLAHSSTSSSPTASSGRLRQARPRRRQVTR